MRLNVTPFCIDPDELDMFTTIMGVSFEQLEKAHYAELLNKLMSDVPDGEPIELITIDRRTADICRELIGCGEPSTLADFGDVDPLEYFGVEQILKDGKPIPIPTPRNRHERRKSNSRKH